MDLDDIEIQSVEVINNPDGTQTCRIGYIPKPRSMQDPYKRAQVQFVQMGPDPQPSDYTAGIPDRPTIPQAGAAGSPGPEPRNNPIKNPPTRSLKFPIPFHQRSLETRKRQGAGDRLRSSNTSFKSSS